MIGKFLKLHKAWKCSKPFKWLTHLLLAGQKIITEWFTMFCYCNSYLYLDCGNIQNCSAQLQKPIKVYKYFTGKQKQHCVTLDMLIMEDPQTRLISFLSFTLSAFCFLFNIVFLATCSSWPSLIFIAFFVGLWKIQLTGIFISCAYVMSAIRSSFCSFKILSRMDLLYLICPISAMP